MRQNALDAKIFPNIFKQTCINVSKGNYERMNAWK